MRPNSESPFTTVLKGFPLFFSKIQSFLSMHILRCLMTVFSEKFCLVKFGSRTDVLYILFHYWKNVILRTTSWYPKIESSSPTKYYNLLWITIVHIYCSSSMEYATWWHKNFWTLIAFKRAIRNITVWCRYIYILDETNNMRMLSNFILSYFISFVAFLKLDFYTRRY